MRWPWDSMLRAQTEWYQAMHRLAIEATQALWARSHPEMLEGKDVIVRCPDCKTDQPAEPIAILETPVLRDGRFIPLVTGRRYACLMCSAVFCVGPQGSFRQHRDSLTYVRRQEEQAEPSRSPLEPERNLPPVYRERPQL
jgi:hypothetical protein